VPKQNVRREVYRRDQPTRIIGASVRVLGTCLTVVATAKMIARPSATENAAKIKRGAITRSLLDHINCINLPRSIFFRPLLGEIGAVKNVLPPFVNFTMAAPIAMTNARNKIVSMTIVLIPEQCRSIESPAGGDRQRNRDFNLKR
jgi:hypothetical protein